MGIILDLLKKKKSERKDRENGEKTDYDPYEHRVFENGTSNLETFIHFIKGAVGTGLLAMPLAFSNAGYVVGIIGTIVVGCLATYCLHVLFKCMHELAKREEVPFLTYPQAMRIAFKSGPPFIHCMETLSGYIVNGLLALYHTGICCAYVVFIAKSIKQVVDFYIITLDVRIHMVCLILPLMLIYNVRSLKQLAPFSTIANILIFVGLTVVCYYIFRDIPSLSERNMSVSITRFPLFFGTTLFALESVGVIISLEQNMESPRDFLGYFGVMNKATFVVLTLYTLFGFFGYWKYGDAALGSITLNIPKTDVLAQVIKLIFALAIYFSYALQGYVTMDILWNHNLGIKLEAHPRKRIIEISIRCGVVIFTVLAALAIPNLGLFLALIGAFCLTLLGIAFPAIMEICTLYPNKDYGCCNYVLMKCVFLILFGTAGLIVGVTTAVMDIIEFYRAPASEDLSI